MSRPVRIGLLGLVTLVGLALTLGIVQIAGGARLRSPLLDAKQLPGQVVDPVPEISFIDSPSATCEISRFNTGICLMTWSYLNVTADPNYIITMTIEIDGHSRARFTGFFQTSMYVPSEMMVFAVPCGKLGSGGNPDYGMTHSYTIRARDSSGLKSANYGSVTCPADTPRTVFLPWARK